MRKLVNLEGTLVLFISPLIYYANMFVFVRVDEKFVMFSSKAKNFLYRNNINDDAQLYVFALLFFISAFIQVGFIISKIKKPYLSTALLYILIGLFSSKGFFGDFLRIGFNPWVSLWLFAPFLLIACTKAEGWQYLKKYVWFPILMDGLVLLHGYKFGDLSERLKGIGVSELLMLLAAYLLVFVGFVKYTTLTYDANRPRTHIRTIWFAIPAFTLGLLITFLFLVMF